MSESENTIRKILRGVKVPILEVKNFKKIRILNCQSIIDDGFEELVGKEFNVIFDFENAVCIEYKNESITFKTGEYETIE